MSFSRIKSFKDALKFLNIQDDVESKKYIVSPTTKSDIDVKTFIRELFKLLNRRLRVFENIQYANEANRERLVDFILTEIVLFIISKSNKNLKVGSKKTISNFNSYGFLDLCVYLEQGLKDEKILIVIEVKEKDVDRGLGQLLLELSAVYKSTQSLTYGIVTTFEDWHFISYYEYNQTSKVKRFNKISFENVSKPDFETFERIVYTLVDITQSHPLI